MLKSEFTDASGRAWQVRITLAHVKPLREAGFNVSAIGKDVGTFDVLSDPETFARVLYLLCESQADKAGVSPEEFAAGLDGPTIHAAADALLAAVADFSHSPAVAKAVKERLPAMLADAEAKTIQLVNAAPPA
ncbi:hypothetical protein [Gemmata sp.]|uniref:hypothetical protein n=1 Tax=Gemmata sp. TaxID=1914242 RepID=UPI003F70EE9D